MRKKIITLLSIFALSVSLPLAGCGSTDTGDTTEPAVEETESSAEEEEAEEEAETEAEETDISETESEAEETASSSTTFSLSDIPEYSGDAYVEVNGNVPYFTEADYTTEAFETYSDLDVLGRCGAAYANVCQELMPTEERESISEVTPTGWHNNSYEDVDGGWVYNRCHLIGYQLTAENANEKNLITGTRYLNIDGMLLFENMVADYVKETDNHVLYRVTPVFDGDNLLASGVLMEGWSVEDDGEGICFCIYAYNVQPGITLDYATGENWADEDYDASASTGSSTGSSSEVSASASSDSDEESTYILNTNTKKFHKPSCSSVSKMSDSNKEEYTGSRQELIDEGYEPCGNCNP